MFAGCVGMTVQISILSKQGRMRSNLELCYHSYLDELLATVVELFDQVRLVCFALQGEGDVEGEKKM